MVTHLHIPSFPLNQFIHSFFYFSGHSPMHSMERFLPDGNTYLLLELTDRPQYIYDNEKLVEIQACKKGWFSGFRTTPITIPSGRESEMVVVSFYRGKTLSFLKDPVHALTDQVVDAELVLKNEILELRDNLIDRTTPAAKCLYLEKELIKFYRNQLAENPFVLYALQMIQEAPQQQSLKALSRQVGYSQKHLIKIFKDHVGVSPKEFLKVIRFQKAIFEIEKYHDINWASLAYDCGFYDQSHFIADFKSFSGFTPSEYMARKGENLNYVPVL